MASHSPRRHLLLTYPRTASNLLVRILAIDKQPNFLPLENEGYFFLPTVKYRFEGAERHLSSWTPEERFNLASCHQTCFQALQNHAKTAEVQGKSVYVKEHAPWLMNPVAETKVVFGEHSIDEPPWTVKAFDDQTRSEGNETLLPDEVLMEWCPTFLIRHPALVFPSIYRTAVDLQGAEAARSEEAFHKLEMTLRWSRGLYDWYVQRYAGKGEWPVVLDADDVMMEPEVLKRYSEIVGLDAGELRFEWDAASKEEVGRLQRFEKRMRSTLLASSGVVHGKISAGLDMNREAEKWKVEFGNEVAEKIESWVQAATPDYEYMRANRLQLKR